MTENKQRKSSKVASITLKDVAREAGVSVATASHVVNGKDRMSADVKKRVLQVINQLGYQPNKAARSMKTGRSMTLGLILPDLRYPFFPALAREVELVAANKQYSVVFANSYADPKKEKQCFERMLQLGVDGIIWFPGSQQDTVPKQAVNMPICVIDRDLENYDVAMPDHAQGGRLQAKHLLQLGHKKFGIVSGPLNADNMTLRVQGASDEINNAAELVWQCESGFQTLSEQAISCLKRNDVTAIIAGDDIIAINIFRELEAMGIQVPKQISVIGFDDIAWCEIVKPSLTTVHIPLPEIAKDAFEMLLNRIDNKEKSRRKSIIGVSLIDRASSQAVKN